MKKTGVAYFAASCDRREKNKRFAESLDLDFPILSDPEGKVAKAYGIYNEGRGFPSRVTFYIGKDGKIAAIDRKVNVRAHGKQILDRIKALSAK